MLSCHHFEQEKVIKKVLFIKKHCVLSPGYDQASNCIGRPGKEEAQAVLMYNCLSC